MIKITYSSREPPSLVIRGHSGYSARGTDIVCAAVSTLFLTLANSLSEYTNDLVSVRSEPGDSVIIWRGRMSEREAAPYERPARDEERIRGVPGPCKS